MTTFHLLGRFGFALLLFTVVLLSGASADTPTTNLIFNPSFENGSDAPHGWNAFALGGSAWERDAVNGSRCVSVTGLGADRSWWECNDNPALQPNHLYRLSYWLKKDLHSTGGAAFAGLDGMNWETTPDTEWSERSFCFRTPGLPPSSLRFRIGQSHLIGELYFDNLSLTPAIGVNTYPPILSFNFGRGESFTNGRYQASHPLGSYGSTDFRCLDRFTAQFNTNRWVFSGESEVVYRHATGRFRQTEGEVEITVSNIIGGALYVEASADGRNWVGLGQMAEVGRAAFPVPTSLPPVKEMWVRLRTGVGAELEVSVYGYRCRLPDTDSSLSSVGDTRYVSIERAGYDLTVDIRSLKDLMSGCSNRVDLLVTNRGVERSVLASIEITQAGRKQTVDETVALPSRQSRRLNLPYTLQATGPYSMTIRFTDVASSTVLWEGSTVLESGC